MKDRWQHRSPFGPLGWLVDRLVLGRYMRLLLKTRNAALKREAESESAADESAIARLASRQ